MPHIKNSGLASNFLDCYLHGSNAQAVKFVTSKWSTCLIKVGAECVMMAGLRWLPSVWSLGFCRTLPLYQPKIDIYLL